MVRFNFKSPNEIFGPALILKISSNVYLSIIFAKEELISAL
jgi:hypothetical protein